MIHDLLPDIKTLYGPVAFVIRLSPLPFNYIALFYIQVGIFLFIFSLTNAVNKKG
jgi:hypothetical protein